MPLVECAERVRADALVPGMYVEAKPWSWWRVVTRDEWCAPGSVLWVLSSPDGGTWAYWLVDAGQQVRVAREEMD